jgi:hypothetical protein
MRDLALLTPAQHIIEILTTRPTPSSKKALANGRPTRGPRRRLC